jgi:hypothetical protein
MQWSPEAVDRLERAIVEGARVQIWRRGTEYMVVPRAIRSRGSEDELVGVTNTGDELSFPFGEIESYEVIW